MEFIIIALEIGSSRPLCNVKLLVLPATGMNTGECRVILNASSITHQRKSQVPRKLWRSIYLNKLRCFFLAPETISKEESFKKSFYSSVSQFIQLNLTIPLYLEEKTLLELWEFAGTWVSEWDHDVIRGLLYPAFRPIYSGCSEFWEAQNHRAEVLTRVNCFAISWQCPKT